MANTGSCNEILAVGYVNTQYRKCPIANIGGFSVEADVV